MDGYKKDSLKSILNIVKGTGNKKPVPFTIFNTNNMDISVHWIDC